MADHYFQHTFENGLTLLLEKMSGVQSAAMTFLLPAGVASDPAGQTGCSTVLSDLVLRGAGGRDSRQLTDYLDYLGLQRSSTAGVHHTRFGCAALARRVIEALPAYGDIVRRPHLPQDGFVAARDLAVQALASVEDEPRQKVMIKLREQHFPYPLGRNTMGTAQELAALSLVDCQAEHARRYSPRQAILAMAGDLDFEPCLQAVGQCFGDWQGPAAPLASTRPGPGSICHQEHASEQTHIGLAYPCIQETDPDYYVMRLAMEVLSGGMSGRLFTEVREKRALVYNVWAGYTSLLGIGAILGYAGTSNDRAQATLDTFIAELYRLGRGVTAEELARAKTGLKAATIMQGESSSARSGAIAHDYFMRGRIRTLDEIKSAIDRVTVEQVNAWLTANPPGPFTIVTVGPQALRTPESR